MLERDDHGVELHGQLVQLVVTPLRHRDADVEVVFADLTDGMVQPSDGAEGAAAELQAHEDTHDHADERAERAHSIQKAERILRKDLRLLKDQNEARAGMDADGIEKFVGAARERQAGKQLHPQRIGQRLCLRRTRAVDRAPEAVEEQKLILCAGLTAEQRLKVGFIDLDHQIAHRRAVAVGQKRARLQERLRRVRRVLGRGIEKRSGLRARGLAENAPVRRERAVLRCGLRGIAPAAGDIVEIEPRKAADALRRAEQLRVDLGILGGAVKKRLCHERIGLQRVQDLLKALVERIKGLQDAVKLCLRRLACVRLQTQAENLQQQRRADQHRHQ